MHKPRVKFMQGPVIHVRGHGCGAVPGLAVGLLFVGNEMLKVLDFFFL